MAELGQIAYMLRKAECPLNGEDVSFCDKPDQAKHTEVCCELAEEDCMEVPASHPCAEIGGAKSIPTGECSSSPGYRSNSTLEAFWQLMVGHVCAPEEPYTCQPIELAGNDPPSEAAARALFFALRVDSQSFRQLFDNIALYYACHYGETAYQGVRSVLCHHRIMDCDAPAPLLCGECGDGVVDDAQGEACDLASIPLSCEDLGYDAGELACNAGCQIVEDGCYYMESESTTGDPMTTGLETTAGPSTPFDSDSTGSMIEDGGCGCRNDPANPGPFGLLGLCAIVGLRRKSQHGRAS